MGLRNLNPLITDADIPASIARDTETAAAIAAHVATADPHSQYGFRLLQKSKVIQGPISYSANSWASLGTFSGFSWGTQGAPSLVGVGISFCFDISFPWQQVCCAALLGQYGSVKAEIVVN